MRTGFTPADIQAAYHLSGLESGGRTVAIVAAYGYSHLEDDLATYRDTFGLPPCTTKSGCLTILNQHGGHHYPPDNRSWDVEQALDVDAVSATCPDCSIVVVQAKTDLLRDLSKAVDEAATHDVVAISNSYGGTSRQNLPSYNHPGIAITAGTGDTGYRTGVYPADDTHVVAVGGTKLVRDAKTRRGWSETAWSAAGSACSEKNKRPTWQRHAKTTCRGRAVADVSAAADPRQSGLSVYFNGRFQVVGGTSESTPIIAAVFALSGRTGGYPARFLYRKSDQLYDIQEGRNGQCGAPLCQARRGWDGPTGVGTPHGVAGF